MYSIVAYGVYRLSIDRKFGLLHLFALLLPIKGIVFEVGLQVLGFYLPLLAFLLIRIILNKGSPARINSLWLFFIIYIVSSTVIISNFFVPHFQPNIYNTYFRTEGRYITYLIKFVLLHAGIFFIFYRFVKDKAQVQSLLKTYLFSLKIIAIIGIAQFLIFIITGFNITPIGLESDGEIRHALSEIIISNIGIPRVCSIGGEPKGLAASLCTGILILSASRSYKIKISSHESFWITIFFAVLLLTLSTGGLLMIVLLIFTLLFLRIIMGDFHLKLNLKALLITIAIILIGTFFSTTIYNIVKIRVLERSDRLLSEDIDQSIQAFMIDQPQWTIFGTGSGNVHNFAYQYIEGPYFREINRHQIFISRYGYIRFISENGYIGLFLFLLFALSIPFKLYKIRKQNPYNSFLLVLTFVIVIFFLARSRYVEAEMYFILGLGAIWLHTTAAQSKRIIKSQSSYSIVQ